MKFKKQLYLITTFLLLQSCNSLGGNNMGFGSNNNWQTYETKIGDVILQYSLPDGQSRSAPKKNSATKIIEIPNIATLKDFDNLTIFDGFWEFRTSRFKEVDGFFKSWAVLKHSLNNFNEDINDFEKLKKSIINSRYISWEIRNKKKLKIASYFSPLKYNKPNGFEKVNINGSIWLKYDNAYYAYPINSKFYITVFVDMSFAFTEKKYVLEAKEMADRIINSLTIIK